VTFAHDDVFTRKRIPPQTMAGGTLGQLFRVGLDMVTGHNVGADVSSGRVVVLQGSTTSHGQMGFPLGGVQVFSVMVGAQEPTIPGTEIPLYRISALLDGGMTIQQVIEDFPSLTADQVVMASNHARQYPNFGKPYPQKSLKRLLRDSGFAQLERSLRGKAKKRS
jgi:uncharacterized protein (DUF433 family)